MDGTCNRNQSNPDSHLFMLLRDIMGDERGGERQGVCGTVCEGLGWESAEAFEGRQSKCPPPIIFRIFTTPPPAFADGTPSYLPRRAFLE